MDPFAFQTDDADIRRERHKARMLRDSQWWKRRLAKGVCYYCQKNVSPQELTMDHIVPVARGGKSTKGNVVPACKACNTAKKQLLPMEWDQYLKTKASVKTDVTAQEKAGIVREEGEREKTGLKS